MLTWEEVIAKEKQLPYFKQISKFVDFERSQGKVVFPPAEDVFNAFTSTAFDNVKVVVLGQDPYHSEGQAHGLSFSVLPGIKIPPSLKNIYKELHQDIQGFEVPKHGCLQSWAEQGVLLLNTVLTVEQGNAHSHSKIGWEIFTDKIIHTLDQQKQGLVFLLWGSHAQKKGKLIDRHKHHVLTSAHPSPLSAHRGFLGCGHFSQTNVLLKAQGHSPIHWHLPQI